MEISEGMEIIDLALYIKKHQALAIADLHLGYEEHLSKKGFLVPATQFDDIFKRIEGILNSREIKTVVITGDFKHEFGKIYDTERKNILKIIDLISKRSKLVIIKGNHDVSLPFITRKRDVELADYYKIGDIILCHGDEIINNEDFKKSKIIIIGHEHPAVGLREKNKYEKYKCFLKGRWEDKTLIVLPAFHSLTIGTDVLRGELLSPFLFKIENFEVYVVEEDKVYNFGGLKKLIKDF